MKRTPLKRSTVPIPKISEKRKALIDAGEIPRYPKRVPFAKSDKPIRKVKSSDKDIRGLMKKADEVFSRYIRERAVQSDGWCYCAICGKHGLTRNMQNGHYISRSHMATRYMEENCMPSCAKCNSRHEEDIEPYKQALIFYGGISLVAYLELMGRKIVKYSSSDLQDIIDKYESLLKQLQ